MNIPTRCITLLTDFGSEDWFVGTMKGVILSLQPRVQLVDLTHGVPPGDTRAGAFALAMAAPFFPRGTIHLAVVDPGVGTARAALAIETDHHLLVGPDNGLLSLAAERSRVRRVHRIENRDLLLTPVSRTFAGRDVFAPVAARLSAGLPCARVGPRAADFVRLPVATVRTKAGRSEGEVIYVDRFGNAITNLGNDLVEPEPEAWTLHCGRRRLGRVGLSYQSVAPGKMVVVPGSTGFLEVAIHGGHAAKRLRLEPGAKVTLSRRTR